MEVQPMVAWIMDYMDEEEEEEEDTLYHIFCQIFNAFNQPSFRS